MSRVLLVSDNAIGSSFRGAESFDKVIFDELGCDFMTCFEFNNHQWTADRYIISNFSGLSEESKNFLIGKNYIHVAHDFLFHPTRIPSLFRDFICPKNELVNVNFLNNAKTIWCQSSFQANIFKLNGFGENVKSWDGNLWSADEIDDMVALNGPKNGRAAVISGQHKGEEQSANLCKQLNIPFDILPNLSYKEFILELSKYSILCFIPNILESWNRVIYEAKLMGVIPMTTNLCGGVHSELWNYNGGELAAKLHLKREEIIRILNED